MNEPSFLSLVPPAVTIFLAVATRHVVLALGVGVFTAMTIHEGFNPFLGLLSSSQKGIFPEIATSSNAQMRLT